MKSPRLIVFNCKYYHASLLGSHHSGDHWHSVEALCDLTQPAFLSPSSCKVSTHSAFQPHHAADACLPTWLTVCSLPAFVHSSPGASPEPFSLLLYLVHLLLQEMLFCSHCSHWWCGVSGFSPRYEVRLHFPIPFKLIIMWLAMANKMWKEARCVT